MPTINRSKSVMIIGSTGLVGNNLFESLEKDISISRIILLGRSFPAITSSKVTLIKTDFKESDEMITAFKDIDMVFCCIGTTISKAGSKEQFRKVDHDIPVLVAKLAFANDVKKFIAISSLGADEKSKNFYLKTKGEMERDVSTFSFQKLAFVRPSLLLGKRKENRIGERAMQMIAPYISFFFIGIFKKYRPIAAITVAKAMLMITNSVNNQKIYESDELLWLGK